MADARAHKWLEAFVAAHGGAAGTVHRVSAGDGTVLELAAWVNIPPNVVEMTQRIPRGKGMAGLAWERDAAVQTCNLKTDASGDVRPGARAVAAQAAVALPVHGAGGVVRAVVGIAYLAERELPEDEVARLKASASELPESQ